MKSLLTKFLTSIRTPIRRRAAQYFKVERLCESLVQHFVDGATHRVILPETTVLPYQQTSCGPSAAWEFQAIQSSHHVPPSSAARIYLTRQLVTIGFRSKLNRPLPGPQATFTEQLPCAARYSCSSRVRETQRDLSVLTKFCELKSVTHDELGRFSLLPCWLIDSLSLMIGNLIQKLSYMRFVDFLSIVELSLGFSQFCFQFTNTAT